MSSEDEKDDSSESEWEEVVETELDFLMSRALSSSSKPIIEPSCQSSSSQLPNEGLKIYVTPKPENPKGKKKSLEEIFSSNLIREVNSSKRKFAKDSHRVTLLCLLAQSLQLNKIIQSPMILSSALSLLPSQHSYPPKNFSLAYLEKFVSWFRQTFLKRIESSDEPILINLEKEILNAIENPSVEHNYFICVFICIALLRGLGVHARLVRNLVPPPLTPHKHNLLKRGRKEAEIVEKESKKKKIKRSTHSNKKSKKDSSDSDSDFTPSDECDSEKMKKKKKLVKRNTGRKIISSDEEKNPSNLSDKNVTQNGSSIKKVDLNYWLEVYSEEEEVWLSVDISNGKIMAEESLRSRASKPICYVIGVSNSGHIRDITPRYSRNWWEDVGKTRDDQWWTLTLSHFQGKRTLRDKAEDNYFHHSLKALPIPSSIGACKNHKLYVLRRHLLKFEAIYPPDTVPCGFIGSEPVYPRETVHTLHARERWIRMAKVVKLGEKAYKVVKGRPKYDKISKKMRDAEPLDLFGEWQTVDYIPPIAQNGIVPRNEYGNVELFLEKMLPAGTIHLKLPSLMRVARKLGIDCAPALVGFEYGGGGCHPKYDGFVICEEFKEVLLDAWNEDQDEVEKRDKEKKSKRVIGNWAKLCRGLLIRDRLEKRYDYKLGGSYSASRGSKKSST